MIIKTRRRRRKNI